LLSHLITTRRHAARATPSLLTPAYYTGITAVLSCATDAFWTRWVAPPALPHTRSLHACESPISSPVAHPRPLAAWWQLGYTQQQRKTAGWDSCIIATIFTAHALPRASLRSLCAAATRLLPPGYTHSARLGTAGRDVWLWFSSTCERTLPRGTSRCWFPHYTCTQPRPTHTCPLPPRTHTLHPTHRLPSRTDTPPPYLPPHTTTSSTPPPHAFYHAPRGRLPTHRARAHHYTLHPHTTTPHLCGYTHPDCTFTAGTTPPHPHHTVAWQGPSPGNLKSTCLHAQAVPTTTHTHTTGWGPPTTLTPHHLPPHLHVLPRTRHAPTTPLLRTFPTPPPLHDAPTHPSPQRACPRTGHLPAVERGPVGLDLLFPLPHLPLCHTSFRHLRPHCALPYSLCALLQLYTGCAAARTAHVFAFPARRCRRRTASRHHAHAV